MQFSFNIANDTILLGVRWYKGKSLLVVHLIIFEFIFGWYKD